MDNNSQPPTQYHLSILLLNLVIAVVVGVCAVLIFLTISGYGSLQLDLPNNVSVLINNHVITSNSFKMRPGNYQIIVTSPLINPYEENLNIGLFRTTVFKPNLQQRSANAIASSVIGAIGTGGGAPQPGPVQWFNNNTWFVGVVSPGPLYLAMYYDNTQQQWAVGYYDVAGYPSDLSKIPVNVATYIENLEAQYAGG
jgi:hypothetical protein